MSAAAARARVSSVTRRAVAARVLGAGISAIAVLVLIGPSAARAHPTSTRAGGPSLRADSAVAGGDSPVARPESAAARAESSVARNRAVTVSGDGLVARGEPPAPPVESAAPVDALTVSFPSNDADITGGIRTTLTGLLLRPVGPGPFPAIVALHGCGGLRSADGQVMPRHDDWARRLRRLGYVVLLVDSFTPRGLTEICTLRPRPITQSRERTRDAYGALLYLQAQPFVRPDRVALLGWSHGGGTVLATVGAKSQGRPPRLPHGDFRAAVAFYPGCVSTERSEWTTAVPLLILVGMKDDWTPGVPCVRLVEGRRARGAPVEIVLYPDAHHGFDAPSSPVRVRTGLAIPGRGSAATVGTDPAARAHAVERVPLFFATHLAR